MTDKISISEIFGPTIQGEGSLVGKPTVFVRSGGCDYFCSWCLHSNTKITLSNGLRKKIKDINIGDVLIGWDELNGVLKETKVVGKTNREEKKLYSIVLKKENGKAIKTELCSVDHMWYTKDGWKHTGELTIGDVILSGHDLDMTKWKMSLNNPMYNKSTSEKTKNTLIEYWKNSSRRDEQRIKQKRIKSHSLNILGDKNPMKNADNVQKQILSRSNWKTSKLELRIQNIIENLGLPFELCNMKVRVGRRYPDFVLKDSKKAIEVFDPTFIDLERKTGDKTKWNGYQLRGDSDYSERRINEYKEAGWKLLPLSVTSNITNEEIAKLLTEFCLNGYQVIKCELLSNKAHAAIKNDFTVYDIKCEPYPTFFANGLLTHNCDTLYAVLPEYRKTWSYMTCQEIFDSIKRLSPDPILVTLSGGNPAIHNFENLIKMGHDEKYTFSIETQGTICPDWLKDIDYPTFSPKPPSSIMKTDLNKLDNCINACEDNRNITLKIVVSDEKDYQYAKNIFSRYSNIKNKYITPCNISPGDPDLEALYDKTRYVANMVIQDKLFDVSVVPQLHVMLWKNKRGV